jgi:hypothetical protein
MAATPSGDGYWVVLETGDVRAFGGAAHHGDRSALANEPIVGIAATPDGRGYWLAAADGGVFTFGSARFYGSAVPLPLAAPIVDIDITPSGRGYWLLGADGGVFSFGDAPFLGRAERSRSDAAALSAVSSGQGYFVTHGNFGPLAFGDAFTGSQLGISHGDDILVDVASTRSGRGAWLVDFRGAVYVTTDGMKHYGGTENLPLQGRITAMTVTPSGDGYWLFAVDGGVFTFGDARFFGRP